MVQDHGKDWRQQPEKVQIANSDEVAALIALECSREAMETGIVTNDTLEAMSSVLELHRVKEDINIPKPLAIVTTEVPHDSDLHMAGLLYIKHPDDAKRLADMTTEELKQAYSQGLTTLWQAQIQDILEILGSYNIVHGSVHQYHIWIDSGTSAWLDFPGRVREKLVKESDVEKLRQVFDVWLKEKMDEEQLESAPLV